MSRISCIAISFAVALTALTGNVAAQQNLPTDKQAQAVANRAIADLAAWKNQSARNYLQNQKAKFGTTPQFQTAWALLEIQEGAAGKKALTTSGTTTLSQMSKNKSVDAIAAYFQGEILNQQKKRPEATAAWQAAAKSAAAAVKADPNDATAQFYLGASWSVPSGSRGATALRLAVRGGFDEPMVDHRSDSPTCLLRIGRKPRTLSTSVSRSIHATRRCTSPGNGLGQAGPQGQHADRHGPVRQAGTERTRCGLREVGSQESGSRFDVRWSMLEGCSMLDPGLLDRVSGGWTLERPSDTQIELRLLRADPDIGHWPSDIGP